MGFWTKVNNILIDRDITRKALAIESNVPKYTIDKGIERDSNASVEIAYKICHTLKVPIETMLDLNSEEQNKFHEEKIRYEQLSIKYSDILEKLDSLSEESREMVIKLIERLK